MITGHSPQMIYSNKCRLVEPRLPKYIPFTWVDGFIVLRFKILAQLSLPPQPASTMTQFTAQTVLSLQASSYHPFAGLSFNQSLLSTPQQVPFPHTSGLGAMGAANAHRHADIALNMGVAVALHGDADALVDINVFVVLDDDAYINVAWGCSRS